MYITRIVLENIRCFEHIELDLGSNRNQSMWTILLGDNGVGKTTVLRSLAMGLVDSTSTGSLLRELYGEWIREQAGKVGEATVRIEFDLKLEDGSFSYIKTSFIKMESGESKVTQQTLPEKFPWDDIFVCGYGAARRAYGSKDYSEYSPVDSIYTLFNYDSPLQNPELILRRLGDTSVNRNEILAWVDKILMLPEGSTKLDIGGITVNGPWGKFMPLGALGDGHQATLAWIVDMLGWAVFYDKTLLKDSIHEFSGIVLLDEIEHHLHPIWQKSIVRLLNKQFPKLQFITTTHSPLCAIGTASLLDEECGLFLLEQEDDRVIASRRLSPPRDQRADQVLTSYLFGLDTTRSEDSVGRIERFSKLLSKKKLTEDEQKDLNALRSELNNELGSGETKIQRLVERAVHESLDKLLTALVQEKPPQEAIDFEIKRKLKDLFEKKI